MINWKTTSSEVKIALVLRYGVLFSGALLLVGWLFTFDPSGAALLSLREYHAEPLMLALQTHFAQGQWGLLLCYAGLVVLVCLPVIRVILTGLIFMHQRDRTMAALVGLVLFGLVLGVTLGA